MDDYRKYVLQRNKTTQNIKNARCAYECKIIKDIKKEPKKLFKYIRSQQTLRPRIGPLEKESGELAQSDTDAAELLNNFFQSVFIDDESDEMPEFADRVGPGCTLSSIQISPAEVP